MHWLILLVVAVAAAAADMLTEDPTSLARKLVDTEQECDQLKNLANIKPEYVDLQQACDEYKLEASYAYIAQNNVSVSADQDRLTVVTSKGEGTVQNPPQLSAEELQGMVEKYKQKRALVENSSNKQGQEIVDQQVLCELQDSTAEDDCSKKLYCLKDYYMADHSINLKDNPQTFPLTYKGKEVKIASPPDTNRSEICQAYPPPTPQTPAAKTEEDEFSELDKLASETPTYKLNGNKMVTKSNLDNPLLKLAMKAATQSLTGGGDDGAASLGANALSLVGPHISDMVTRNLISKMTKGANLPVPIDRKHVNTLMKVATNGFKSKDKRDPITKADLKSAVEVVTKTAVHFTILALKARKNGNEVLQKKKKGFRKFLETLEVAIIDAIAASIVEYIVDVVIPDDEEPPTPPPTPAPKGGFLGSKGGFMSAIQSAASLASAAMVNDGGSKPATGKNVSKSPPPEPAGDSPVAAIVKGLASTLLKNALSA